MTDDEYIKQVQKAREESVRYFGSKNKQERERWVAIEFLKNLGLSFSESEVQSAFEEPPDVRFRSAAFEVKEIQDPGRRRHAEFKAAAARAKSATSIKDLFEPVTSRDTTYAEVCDQIEYEVARFADKYPADVRAQLDLLFYVNLDNVYGHLATSLPPPSRWEKYGFRSILALIGRGAGVLMVSGDTPEFIAAAGPRVMQRRREGEPGGAI